jgi:hypothetical protein
MVNLSAMRLASRTYALDLTTTASAALLITPSTNDQVNYVQLLNTGSGIAGVEFSNNSTVTVPVVATTGISGCYVLPAAMTYPIVIAVPQGPFYMKGISTGTNTLYITATLAD